MAIKAGIGINRSSGQVSKANRVPAPIKGVDARTVLSEGDQLHSIYAFNVVPGEYGVKVRRGYREWCIGLEINPGFALGVGTIIPFGGVDADPSNDRLFAVTNEGIFDVTNYNAPVVALDFSLPGNGGDLGVDTGNGVYTQYTTDAGEQLLFYADSKNGLFQYSQNTDVWTRSTGINGPVIEDILFVTSHKKQLWFIEQDSSKAWYLPIASIAGDAEEFFFGSKFKHGGNLSGLFSWSIDGGNGVDDYLVAISRSGDVMPYQGNNPSSSDDWASVGQWFIGAVPKGNRCGTQHGGNLLFLSAFGLIAMSDLLEGVEGKDIREQAQSLKISAILNKRMTDTRTQNGWSVKFIPTLGSIIISEPKRINGTYEQAVLNMTTDGWGFWRDVPIYSFDEWAGDMYFGTKDNRVMISDIDLDESLITPDPNTTINGRPIDFSLLTTFQDYGEPALFKRGKYVRAQFISKSTPFETSKFKYDYDLTEFINSATSNYSSVAVWDTAVWESSIWGSDIPFGVDILTGSWGMGRTLAVATRGSSTSETTIIGWDVIWDTGAPV